MVVSVSATISHLSQRKDKLRYNDLKCLPYFEDKWTNCNFHVCLNNIKFRLETLQHTVCISSIVKFFVYLMKDLQLKPLLSLSHLCPLFSFLIPNSPHLFLSLHCQEGRETDLGLSFVLKKNGDRCCDTVSGLFFIFPLQMVALEG